MPKYTVTCTADAYILYEVEAEDEDEARESVLNGDGTLLDEWTENVQVMEIEDQESH